MPSAQLHRLETGQDYPNRRKSVWQHLEVGRHRRVLRYANQTYSVLCGSMYYVETPALSSIIDVMKTTVWGPRFPVSAFLGSNKKGPML